MWLGEILGLNTTVTGVIASLISSLLAGIALGKIANHMGINPQITVAVWYLAPMAVFLFAPYAESIFAAFSFWAWYLALKGNWIAAGLLGGFAAFTRSNGIFLGIALIVLFLVSKKRDWRMAPFLLLPFVAVGIYFAYLYTLTGSWTYWYEAQAQGWDRSFTNPINSTLNTIQMAIDAPENGLTVSRLLSELANTFIVLGIGIILLIKKWWAEATYVFITMASLITGEFFQSTMRATLILFPVWLYIGLLATKNRPFRFGYFIIAVPFLTLIITRYVDGQWIS
jgi:Gpi18-like mannosyltransferase